MIGNIRENPDSGEMEGNTAWDLAKAPIVSSLLCTIGPTLMVESSGLFFMEGRIAPAILMGAASAISTCVSAGYLGLARRKLSEHDDGSPFVFPELREKDITSVWKRTRGEITKSLALVVATTLSVGCAGPLYSLTSSPSAAAALLGIAAISGIAVRLQFKRTRAILSSIPARPLEQTPAPSLPSISPP